MDEKDNEIIELRKEIRMLKILYCKCGDCIHANLYLPHYTYPYANPRCELTGNEIQANQNACEDFEREGRNSR